MITPLLLFWLGVQVIGRIGAIGIIGVIGENRGGKIGVLTMSFDLFVMSSGLIDTMTL